MTRLLSFDYATGKATAINTTTVGGVARAYAFVPRSRWDTCHVKYSRLEWLANFRSRSLAAERLDRPTNLQAEIRNNMACTYLCRFMHLVGTSKL